MKIKSFLARPFASYIYKQTRKGMQTALEDQKKVFKELLKTGKSTDFGLEHHFGDIDSYESFRQAVPVRDYESIKPWIDKIKEGPKFTQMVFNRGPGKSNPVYCVYFFYGSGSHSIRIFNLGCFI